MSRPPVYEVDASVQAHVNGAIDRRFSGKELPRLLEAGIVEATDIELSVRFATLESHVALDGRLSGSVTMTCQRCMQPVAVDIEDEFRLVIVREEPEAEIGGYDPVVADPSRLDLRWLAEEQALLSVPLVPKHEALDCAAAPPAKVEVGEDENGPQRPFANLKDLLRK
jgi:uncharacterized protein